MNCFPNKLRLIFLLVLLFLLVATLEIEERRLFTERQINDNWASFQKYFNSQRVLHLYQPGLSETMMLRILGLPMLELEELHFQQDIPKDLPTYRYRSFPQQTASEAMLKTIFTSAYFPHLKTLNLKKTNIDQRYFQFLLNNTLQTSLQTLVLEDCYIGKRGFALLAEVKWTGLKSINVYNTLLKEGEAVDALIRVICGNGDNCTNSIEQLNIGMTNIESENFIRLMGKINPQSLKRLRLSTSEKIQEICTYKQGFDYSAFRFLANSFSQLELLDLSMSLIDDEVAKIFADWKLPNLITLDLQDNHLTDQGVSTWITKFNMPKLTELFLLKNQVSDGTISHLASEAFEFTSFSLGGKISERGAESLDSLNTKQMQTLKLQFQIPSDTLNRYITNNSFANLRSLTFIKNDLLINAFTRVNWSRLTKLQSLTLQTILLKDSLTDLFQTKKEAVSSNLRYLIINNPQLSSQLASYLVKRGPVYFPKLEQLIVADLHPVLIVPEAFDTPYKNGTFFDIYGMQLIKRGKIYDIINLASLDFLFTPQVMKYPFKLPELARNYTFDNLERVSCSSTQKLDYFLTVLELAGVKELPYLRSLQIQIQLGTEIIRERISQLSMPSLKGLVLGVTVAADQQDAVQNTLLPFLQKLPLLSWMTLNTYFLNEDTGSKQRKLLLDLLYFPHLVGFKMATRDMEVYQLETFIRRHNKTVRSINLDNNFLEKGLLAIFVESGYILQALSLQSISFTVKEFALFASLRTDFLYSLFLLQTDLGNDHIIQMLSSKGEGPFFPKLTVLNLKGNSIHKQGLQALLQTKMFRLSQLDLNLNSNPQYINLLLTYPTRIQYIQAANVETYGILSYLQPHAARYIKKMEIKTKSFFREDFSSLARLNFSRMADSQLDLSNIYECEVLRDLLMINRGVEDVRIFVENDRRGLNSSCLKDMQYQSHANYVSIFDKYSTTYLPQFITYLLKTNSAIKFLTLYNTKLPSTTIEAIFSQGSFTQLQVLILEGNYLGDSALRPLLKGTLNNLVYLDLSNTEIASSAIDGLVGVKMSRLRILALNKNKLDKKVMESIAKLQAKKLFALSLENCDLNRDSLEVIANFEFPKLSLLFLDYNNFQEADVIQFASNLSRKLLPVINELRLRGVALSNVGRDSLSNILATKKINHIIDPPQQTTRVNSARY